MNFRFKMISANTLTLLLMLTTFVFNSVSSNPALVKNSDRKHNFEELSDLNKELTYDDEKNQSQKTNFEAPAPFSHRDEDQLSDEPSLNGGQSLKYDFEILESGNEIRKENIEIEERFKGNSIEINTDIFTSENIEVNGGDGFRQSHMTLTIILAIVALVSIGLYAALVIWRSYLEQRYGMRELLVDFDDSAISYESSSDHISNRRHPSVMQL